MLSDGLYYLASLLLAVANVAAWCGVFYRLPGNWIIVANCTLAMALLPVRANGLGISWFTVCLLTMIAILGDSFTFAAKNRQILTTVPEYPNRKRVLVSAAVGSLVFAIAGAAVPVVATLTAILGGVGGAAGGAFLGTLFSPRRPQIDAPPSAPRHRFLLRFFSEDQLRLMPRLVAGLCMVAISLYACLL